MTEDMWTVAVFAFLCGATATLFVWWLPGALAARPSVGLERSAGNRKNRAADQTWMAGGEKTISPAKAPVLRDEDGCAFVRVGVYEQPDEMCPNCVTPWKCNGPHVSRQAETELPVQQYARTLEQELVDVMARNDELEDALQEIVADYLDPANVLGICDAERIGKAAAILNKATTLGISSVPKGTDTQLGPHK